MTLILTVIVVALIFEYINGFHDTANSIATVVSTKVLTPRQAVVMAAITNLAGAMWGTAVAKTIASGLVDTKVITSEVLICALFGAIVWNLITWRFGMPSSSSHALLGGFGGAAIVHAGKWVDVLYMGKVVVTVEFIVIAPLVGLVLGLVFVFILMWVFRKVSPIKMDRWFRVAQLGSAAAYSLGHGTNDAQKTMGIIAALLYASIWKTQQAAFATGKIEFPFWIVLVCHLAIGLGTMAGGWRIVKTMGMRITKLRPYDGACAELAAATSLFTSAAMGIPVSTTHTIAGAIVGVGAVHRLSAVRWGVARQVVWAWVLTIPCSGIVAALVYWALMLVR